LKKKFKLSLSFGGSREKGAKEGHDIVAGWEGQIMWVWGAA